MVANHRRSPVRRDRLDRRVAEHADYVWREEATGLDSVLAALRDDDREVLMLVAWEGLGPEDLGRALGCSSSTATVRLHRARTRLSATWDELGGSR